MLGIFFELIKENGDGHLPGVDHRAVELGRVPWSNVHRGFLVGDNHCRMANL